MHSTDAKQDFEDLTVIFKSEHNNEHQVMYATMKRTREIEHRKKISEECGALKLTLTTTKTHLYLPASVLQNAVSCANITEC